MGDRHLKFHESRDNSSPAAGDSRETFVMLAQVADRNESTRLPSDVTQRTSRAHVTRSDRGAACIC